MRRPTAVDLLRVALVAGAYYASAELGLSLAFETRNVTAVWPPTGIALAAIVLWGPRLWPGVALGAFLANAWTDVPIGTVLGITVGNTLEALAGGYLLRRADFRPDLARARDVLALAVLAGGLSTTVSATIGVTSSALGDVVAWERFWSVWRVWWLGDMGGDLLVAPLLLVAATWGRRARPPGRLPEAVALVALLVGVSLLVFSRTTPLSYLVFPPLIWAALRFWQVGAAAGSLVVAGIAVAFAANDRGPFVDQDPDDSLLLAQTFVSVAGVTALVLASVIAERARAVRTVQHVAETLQESILPSQLPVIPSVEVATYFRPAGAGDEVGGDFYDVFDTGDGSWAIAIGDVCGKGADAAAITGLARYTLRAAAITEDRPSRILALLNEAILQQRASEEFCTVAYASLHVDNGRARLEVSSGGHPLPLLVRAADGSVEAIARPGTLLGAVEAPSLSEATVDLSPGDAVLFYTDGLTDAYAPEHVVDPDELSAALGAGAGESAREIVARLRRTVLRDPLGAPRDDIALLVLRLAPTPDYREVTMRLPPEPQAVGAARGSLDALGPVLGSEELDTVRLLVSELVTNSIRHAGAPPASRIELKATASDRLVRVEVSDRGAGFVPDLREPRWDQGSGWGLQIVDRLSDRWGVRSEGRTCVWFELDRSA